MRILIAPDSFKESLDAAAVAEALAAGVRRAVPAAVVDLCPIADGGEGTADALTAAMAGRVVPHRVSGPLGEPVEARLSWVGERRLAIVEAAHAAGLALVPPERRDPTRSSSFGVGQLIAAALDLAPHRLIIGIGGSATCDAGTGMAQALGAAFIGGACPMTGGRLAQLTRVDTAGLDPRLRSVHIEAACDVTNPLFGPTGAAHVYAPQKGAGRRQVEALDAGLRHLASLMPGVDPDAPGMGAAGGLGFGLVAFCGARLRSGIELVLDAVGFDRRLAAADLVITGEGRLDAQTASGKACLGVARAAAARAVPVIAIVGSLGPGSESARGVFAAVHAVCDGVVGVEQAMADPRRWIAFCAEQAMRSFRGVQ